MWRRDPGYCAAEIVLQGGAAPSFALGVRGGALRVLGGPRISRGALGRGFEFGCKYERALATVVIVVVVAVREREAASGGGLVQSRVEHFTVCFGIQGYEELTFNSE